MFSNLILLLTSITYIGLIVVNLYKPKGTGDQLVLWGFVVFGALAAYVVSSLMLTINIAIKGKFDWISESSSLRNSIIGIGWLCLMAGVVYSTMINADWKTTGTANWLGLIMVWYGAIWIPLLMLVPYAILLNPEWQNVFSPNVYRIPLMIGCLIGIGFQFINHEKLSNLLRDKKAIDEIEFQNAMKQISNIDNTIDLLRYTQKDTDSRIKQAAVAKLKSKENLELELLNILSECGENYDYLSVLSYLKTNKVEQPELFIKPLNKALFMVSEELKHRINNFSSEKGFLKLLHVDEFCQMLEWQFKSYSQTFRTNMLKIQTELEKETKPEYLEITNRYKAAVKHWLDTQS